MAARTFRVETKKQRRTMVSQLRIYTINRGMMDSWLKLFHEHLKP